MNKRGRIVIVVSIVNLFALVLPTAFNSVQGAIAYCLILIVYWSYRFIKNDISFLKIKDE